MSVHLETDALPDIDCWRCGNTGDDDGDRCPKCGGWSDESVWHALATLAHNLAVAGALCRAFRLGDTHGWTEAMERDDDDYRDTWAPNVAGRAAP